MNKHELHCFPEAAYIHIPFCISKCYYCDFNSYPGMELVFQPYVDALISEISRASEGLNGTDRQPLTSVYFGGGTPTILSAEQLASILSAIIDSLHVASDCEITVEANPGTIDEYKIAKLKAAMFNRLSMGVQSLDDEYLARIGRVHTAQQALEAYENARRAGFTNISIDLIFALPGQNLRHWQNTLKTAIDLNPEHISLYELSIEEGTRFAEMCVQGKLDLPDEDTQVDMYEMTISELASAGYEHYEVSNFARPGYRSRHNQVYWRNEPYYGFGAGATSYICGDRSRRIADPRKYIQEINSGSDAVEFSEHLTGHASLTETIIQGLRMLDGISMSKIKAKTGADIGVEFRKEIENLTRRGLLEIVGDQMRVTHQGLLLLNDVAEEFVSPPEE